MPVNPEFANFIIQALNATRPIRHKVMFGGIGFYFEEVFFAVADDDRLFFKVDEASAKDYEAYGMGPWPVAGTMNDKYREVPSEILADSESLGRWIEKSAQVALAKSKKTAKR